MKLSILKYWLFLNAVLLISCFEEDEPVEPWPGEVFTISEDVEKNFSYFDFETGRVVHSHAADAWQLGFDCTESGWAIQVNSGDNWFVWNSGIKDFQTEIIPPVKTLWNYDVQSLFPDSSAVGRWVQKTSANNEYTNDVYFLGRYQFGKYENIIRLQFLHVDEDNYLFRMREESSGFSDSISIEKKPGKGFTYFDFTTRMQKDPEPESTAFDILFCPYFDLVTQLGQTIPYLVRGTFINNYETTAAIDSTNAYEVIDYEMLPAYDFTTQRDIIGYNWKDVSIDVGSGTATYKVKPYYAYIIKTSSGRYYKLRFLSFSIDGISGYPRFEYKELKAPAF